jgi:hypothetical protein
MTPTDQIIQKIDRKIKHRRSCSVLNYIITTVRRDFTDFSGNTGRDEFVLWKYSWWTGAFFAVISGKVKPTPKGESVVLVARMNSFGKLVSVLALIMFSYGWFYPSAGFSPLTFRAAIAGLLLMGSFSFIFFLIYRNTRKELIEEVTEILKENH